MQKDEFAFRRNAMNVHCEEQVITLWGYCMWMTSVRRKKGDLCGVCRVVSERHFQYALLPVSLMGDGHRSD